MKERKGIVLVAGRISETDAQRLNLLMRIEERGASAIVRQALVDYLARRLPELTGHASPAPGTSPA
jgi:hypothetical protein